MHSVIFDKKYCDDDLRKKLTHTPLLFARTIQLQNLSSLCVCKIRIGNYINTDCKKKCGACEFYHNIHKFCDSVGSSHSCHENLCVLVSAILNNINIMDIYTCP